MMYLIISILGKTRNIIKQELNESGELSIWSKPGVMTDQITRRSAGNSAQNYKQGIFESLFDIK